METEKGIETGILRRFKLNPEEINNILDIIDNQLKKSRKNGLVIEKNDLIIEKFLFLCILEQWGGVEKVRRDFNVKQTEEEIDGRIEKYFHPFKLNGDIKDKERKEKNQQKYFLHLEEVKRGIISLIFKNKL
jgi:hypothetical protein